MTEDTKNDASSDTGASGAQRREPMELQQAFIELGRLPLDSMPLGQVLARVAELARRPSPAGTRSP